MDTTTTTHDLGHNTSFLASPGVSLSVKLVCVPKRFISCFLFYFGTPLSCIFCI